MIAIGYKEGIQLSFIWTSLLRCWIPSNLSAFLNISTYVIYIFIFISLLKLFFNVSGAIRIHILTHSICIKGIALLLFYLTQCIQSMMTV